MSSRIGGIDLTQVRLRVTLQITAYEAKLVHSKFECGGACDARVRPAKCQLEWLFFWNLPDKVGGHPLAGLESPGLGGHLIGRFWVTPEGHLDLAARGHADPATIRRRWPPQSIQ
jgi:hypothetical protein